jgi:serine/threonine-protein kinase
LEINIDKAKKERDVAEIVESDDFKLLEQQANKLRQKVETATESPLEAETQERSALLPRGDAKGERSSASLSPFSKETAIAQPAEPEVVAPEPQSKAKTPPSLNPEFLEHCRQELARCIGPFASALLEDTLAQSPHLTPEQLIEALTAEIPDPQRAQEFRSHIKIPPQSLFQTEAPLDATFSEQRINAHPARLNPEFLEHCRQELMHCTGPMADVLLKDTLAQSPHLAPDQLVEALAAEIPDPQRVQEFKNRMEIQ